MPKNKKLASDILTEVANTDIDKVTLFERESSLREQGFCILIIILSLPLSLPIPVPPGYTTILAISLLYFYYSFCWGLILPGCQNG